MPKFLEDKLKAAAAEKGYTGRNADAYVFGTMNKLGAMHGNKETAKGAAMQKKYDEKERPGQRDSAAEDVREAARSPRKRSNPGNGLQGPPMAAKKPAPKMKPLHARMAAAMSAY